MTNITSSSPTCPTWAAPNWALLVFLPILLVIFGIAMGSFLDLWIMLHWKDEPDPFKTMLLMRARPDGTWYITAVKSRERYRALLKEMAVKWCDVRGGDSLELDSFYKPVVGISGDGVEEVKGLEV